MQLDLSISNVESYPSWLLHNLAVRDLETMVQLATNLWGIWNARNLKVWENKAITSEIAMRWSVQQVTQWREAQNMSTRNANRVAQRVISEVRNWQAPEVNRFKVNVDASVFSERANYSIGMILRDHEGGFCRARSMCQEGEVSVFET